MRAPPTSARWRKEAGTNCCARTLAVLACTSLGGPAVAHSNEPEPAPQELRCFERGWTRLVVGAAGLRRLVLWKAPRTWTKGAILVMHGGGGRHFHWCAANAPIVAPQARFSELAVETGFAVFLLESTNLVTDDDGRPCGKVWDDESRARPNLDLPFFDEMLRGVLPRLRPSGSRPEIFLTGLSSGGYMAVRAATRFGDQVAAFAPVSSGDPYGWHRVCERGLTSRIEVQGVALDSETGRRISEPGACHAEAYARERPWDSSGARPPFRRFHHEDDGVHDASCGAKLGRQLRRHGYPETEPFLPRGDGRRTLANHLWLDAYSAPLLEFFARHVGSRE